MYCIYTYSIYYIYIVYTSFAYTNVCKHVFSNIVFSQWNVSDVIYILWAVIFQLGLGHEMGLQPEACTSDLLFIHFCFGLLLICVVEVWIIIWWSFMRWCGVLAVRVTRCIARLTWSFFAGTSFSQNDQNEGILVRGQPTVLFGTNNSGHTTIIFEWFKPHYNIFEPQHNIFEWFEPHYNIFEWFEPNHRIRLTHVLYCQ